MKHRGSFVWSVAALVIASCSSGPSGPTDCADKGFTECKDRCDQGDATACYWTGEFLFTGTSGDKGGTPVVEDKPRALTYYSKACDAKNDDGCIGLAYAHVAGRGTSRNLNKAIEIADPVCSRGRGKACGLLVRALESAGMDSGQARERTIAAYKKECDAAAGPCWSLVTEGLLPVDEALKYLKIHCAKDDRETVCKKGEAEQRTFVQKFARK